jgi:hypothetical protein
MRNVGIGLALIAVAGASVAGCGGGGSTAQPVGGRTTVTLAPAATGTTSAARASTARARAARATTTVKLCSLLTRHDVSLALHESAPKPTSVLSVGGVPASCAYGGLQSVTVSVRAESATDFDQKQIQQVAGSAGGRALAGIGDAAALVAYAAPPGATTVAGLVTFVKAHSYVTISISLAAARKTSLATVAAGLARSAASRL